ncbi:MAG: hypothetical protein M3O15_05655 [Acidobacteriota bacterium]|nr:hypothetical protein [Acidobacteriota bacterium]
MTSKRTSDPLPFGDEDLPTRQADILALRENRPRIGGDWLQELSALSRQFSGAVGGLGRRGTFAGLPRFEL